MEKKNKLILKCEEEYESLQHIETLKDELKSLQNEYEHLLMEHEGLKQLLEEGKIRKKDDLGDLEKENAVLKEVNETLTKQ